MRNAARTQSSAALPAFLTLLGCMLALAPMPLMAATYKCTRDGQVTYSDVPCGAGQQAVKSQVVVVPSTQGDAPAQKSSGGGLSAVAGMSARDMVIYGLLFGIPLSFAVVFFMSRSSGSSTSIR